MWYICAYKENNIYNNNEIIIVYTYLTHYIKKKIKK